MCQLTSACRSHLEVLPWMKSRRQCTSLARRRLHKQSCGIPMINMRCLMQACSIIVKFSSTLHMLLLVDTCRC